MPTGCLGAVTRPRCCDMALLATAGQLLFPHACTHACLLHEALECTHFNSCNRPMHAPMWGWGDLWSMPKTCTRCDLPPGISNTRSAVAGLQLPLPAGGAACEAAQLTALCWGLAAALALRWEAGAAAPSHAAPGTSGACPCPAPAADAPPQALHGAADVKCELGLCRSGAACSTAACSDEDGCR